MLDARRELRRRVGLLAPCTDGYLDSGARSNSFHEPDVGGIAPHLDELIHAVGLGAEAWAGVTGYDVSSTRVVGAGNSCVSRSRGGSEVITRHPRLPREVVD